MQIFSKQIQYESLILVIALLVRFLPYQLAFFSYIIISVYAFLGPSQAIKALLFGCLLTVINTNFFPDVSSNPLAQSPLGQYIILLSFLCFCAFRLIKVRVQILNTPLSTTLFLGLFFIVHSIIFSQVLEVSILKFSLWFFLMLGLIFLWSSLSLEEHKRLIHEIFFFLGMSIFLSLPLVFFNDGYSRNFVDFQGLFNGPQVLGIICSLVLSFLLGLILSKKNPSIFLVTFLLFTFIIIFLTGSRTGFFAVFLALLACFIIGCIFVRNPIKSYFLIFTNKYFYIFLTILVMLLSSLSLVEKIISKRTTTSSIFEAYEKSRFALFDPIISNINKQPFAGIGFGVASDYKNMKIARDPYFNIPYGASIEKGNIFLAVMEEVGALGLCIFLIWLIYIFRIALENGLEHIMVFSAIIFLNLGESMLFSPGSIGLLCMILLTWLITSNLNKNSQND